MNLPSTFLLSVFLGTLAFTLPSFGQEKSAIPTVKFSREHAALNLVNVGDEFPTAKLEPMDGGTVDLKSQLGKKLTVIVVWDNKHAFARESYRRLGRLFVLPHKGAVKGIGINRRDDEKTLKAAIKKLAKT